MKKAIALLATLAVVATTAFAQLAPSISGHAETKWGTNLTDETNGFELDTDVTVTVPFVTAETVATEDGEGATGSAEIEGSSLTFTFGLDEFDDDGFFNNALNDNDGSVATGTDASISAKIKFLNGAYATIGSESDIEANFASGDKNYWVKPGFGEDAGISLGFDNGTAMFEFTIANEDDGYLRDGNDDGEDATYEGDTDVIAEDKIELTAEVDETTTAPTDEDAYIIGAKASYTAGDIFTGKVAFGTSATASVLEAEEQETAFAVEVASTPIAGLTITVPFDFYMRDGNNAFELLPAVAYSLDALTLGLDFHYITVAADLASTLADDDYVGQKLNFNVAYALAVGTPKLELASNLAETGDNGEAADMDLEVTTSWTADTYSATLALGNVLHEDGMDDIGFDATFSGVAGMAASLETTISLDEDRDNSEAFTLDKINLDFTSELTGVENTTFTVNFSEFNGDDAKGIFYVGAKVAL